MRSAHLGNPTLVYPTPSIVALMRRYLNLEMTMMFIIFLIEGRKKKKLKKEKKEKGR